MEKKILFLRASTGWKDPSPPLAFAYLGRIARDRGFKVLIENLNAQYNTKTTEDIIELIKKEQPAIVGVSIFTNYARDSYELIKKIKNYCKMIIAGGPHITIYPEEALEMGADVAFIGEAESSFPIFLDVISKNKKLNKVPGIAYKENGKVKRNKETGVILNLDRIPIPDKEFFRKEDYIKIKEEINNFGGILTSRGCPGRCTYCYHSLFGRGFRYRSAGNVFKEVLYLHNNYGITHINFIDDAFTINKERLEELCGMFIKAGLPIEWVCATRIDFLNREMIFKMKKAGCVMISLGVESCVPETLIKIKKTGNPEWYIKQADEILKACYDAGIRAGVNILTGFPWDSVEDIKQIQKYVDRIKVYVTQGFCGGILQPMPNTEIYEQYAKQYKFEKWWLTKESIFREDYHPFFMSYYHVFWEQMQNNFFNLNKNVLGEIDRLYRSMGKWNLRVIVKRRFKNSAISWGISSGLVVLSNISLFLYKVSPKLEKLLMSPVARFSYKFKYAG
ncbi:B12-binding domain-containing radical SAM protein [Candidatus Pacearchaeota archaeon]|nr:B12-binding domain-containing radical SAM protein [Candidatus Pacearchaeota archaeon]